MTQQPIDTDKSRQEARSLTDLSHVVSVAEARAERLFHAAPCTPLYMFALRLIESSTGSLPPQLHCTMIGRGADEVE